MNWRHQRGGMGGTQSTGTAILILVLGGFFYLQQTGGLNDILKMIPDDIKAAFQIEEAIDGTDAEKAAKQKNATPDFAITTKNLAAFDNYQNGQQIAIVEANAKLPIKDYHKNEQGSVDWIKVNSNGLSVWIVNDGLNFEFKE